MGELFEQLMEKMKKEMEGVVRETMLEVLRDEKKYEYPARKPQRLQATAKTACTKCIPRVRSRALIK